MVYVLSMVGTAEPFTVVEAREVLFVGHGNLIIPQGTRAPPPHFLRDRLDDRGTERFGEQGDERDFVSVIPFVHVLNTSARRAGGLFDGDSRQRPLPSF